MPPRFSASVSQQPSIFVEIVTQIREASMLCDENAWKPLIIDPAALPRQQSRSAACSVQASKKRPGSHLGRPRIFAEKAPPSCIGSIDRSYFLTTISSMGTLNTDARTIRLSIVGILLDICFPSCSGSDVRNRFVP